MQWTDRIRQVKIVLVIVAIVIAVVSLLVSHYLVRDLQREERNKMKTWAEALQALNNADETTDLTLVLNVIQSNNTIPVIVLTSDGTVTDCRNIDVKGRDSAEYVAKYGQQLYKAGDYIKIEYGDSTDYQLVCYDESTMLKRLTQWPYVQLGTPISSLMAWVEILKENYPQDDLIPEMDKDVKRLERIAERFSKIGSLPEPVESSMNEVLEHVVDYMDRRTSKKVEMVRDVPDHDIRVRMNASLFEWVIENLCKNAVDAMEGSGRIVLTLMEEPGRVVIEVADNGKGIRKKDINNVFTPGFTTKKRGWGLGLSLAKRIVEEYHKGRIFVKQSEVGVGTTFRIEMRKNC